MTSPPIRVVLPGDRVVLPGPIAYQSGETHAPTLETDATAESVDAVLARLRAIQRKALDASLADLGERLKREAAALLAERGVQRRERLEAPASATPPGPPPGVHDDRCPVTCSHQSHYAKEVREMERAAGGPVVKMVGSRGPTGPQNVKPDGTFFTFGRDLAAAKRACVLCPPAKPTFLTSDAYDFSMRERGAPYCGDHFPARRPTA